MDETLHHAEMAVILGRCALIFGIAGLIVPVFNRLHISPVLGFLLCGVMIGPHTLGLILSEDAWAAQVVRMDDKTISLLGELGIMALLFMIGLELPLDKLRELKKYILGLGSAQIVGTGIIITGIALFFGNDPQSAIVIGAGFALSSTAIVMQLLQERGLARRAAGRIGFSVLLMQDIAVVPILVMIGTFAGAGEDARTSVLILEALGVAVLVIGLIYGVGTKIVQPALHSIAGTKKDEWLAAFALFVLCAIALLTLKAGLSAALGAFLAGILMAETEFREKIEQMLSPLKTVLLGVFFISIGMMVNPVAVLASPFWIGASVAGIFAVKALTLYPLCRMFGVRRDYARGVAMMLCQPGEFTLMIISVSMAAGLIADAAGQFFLLVAVMGMLVTPLLFRFLPAGAEAVKDGSMGPKS